MQCPNCAATVPDGAAFCPACGSKVAGVTQPMPNAPPPPPPGPPVAPPPLQAAAGAPSAPSSRSKTGLVIGIVIGFVVLLLMCGVGWALFAQALVPKSGTDFSELPAGSESSALSETVTATEAIAPTAPVAAAPEPPPAAAPAQEPAPVPDASLTEANAIDLVMTHLQDAMNGDSAKAKAVTTARFRAEKTSDYYSLAAHDLKEFGMVDTQKGDGGYLVFVKEKWSQGTWTNWYLVVKKNGKLVIDNIGTE